MNDDSLIKKNILDLHFQKNLVIMSTSIIIAFTYFIGIAVAYTTKQINLNDPFSIFLVSIISITILGVGSVFFFNAYFHIKEIPKIIKNLKYMD